MSQCQKITVTYKITFTGYSIKAFNHAECLLITNNNDIRIMLLYQTNRAGMIRFHMIDYKIVYRLITYYSLYFFKKNFKIANVHGINKCNHIVINQI